MRRTLATADTGQGGDTVASGCGLSPGVLRHHFLVLARDPDDKTKPHDNERDVDQRVLWKSEGESRSDEHDDGLHEVAGTPEERIDCLLRLVLHLAARRQEERLAGCVLDGVVRAVFERLREADDREDRQERDRTV